MSTKVNKILFKTPAELLSYREILESKIQKLSNKPTKTDLELQSITRHGQYLTFTDMLLHDAFLETAKEKIAEGLNVDRLMFPDINPIEFLQGAKMLAIGGPRDSQGTLQFSDHLLNGVSTKPIDVEIQKPTDTGMPLEKLIGEIFKLNGNKILTVVNAAKVYAGKMGLDVAKEGLDTILDKFVNDERFNFVKEMKEISTCGLWTLGLIKQTGNAVKAILNLKLKFFDNDPMEVGQLFAWISKFAFEKHNKDGKHNGWEWKDYIAAMDAPFRLAEDENDIAGASKKREKAEKDRLQGVVIMRDNAICREIYTDARILDVYGTYAANTKDAEKKKMFYDKDNKLRQDVFVRTIEECMSYGSYLRRSAIMERRIKQLTGESPKKDYKEGNSGYDKK